MSSWLGAIEKFGKYSIHPALYGGYNKKIVDMSGNTDKLLIQT
jgi:hypothetical protein